MQQTIIGACGRRLDEQICWLAALYMRMIGALLAQHYNTHFVEEQS